MEATDLFMQKQEQIDELLAVEKTQVFEIDSRGSLEIENHETIIAVHLEIK